MVSYMSAEFLNSMLLIDDPCDETSNVMESDVIIEESKDMQPIQESADENIFPEVKEDFLTCGTCGKTFFLSKIVDFIRVIPTSELVSIRIAPSIWKFLVFVILCNHLIISMLILCF